MMKEPCEACVNPEHCLGTYAEDDPHRPGQQRGCYAEKTRSLQVTTVAGKTMDGKPEQANPQWEKGRAGERRPDGSFMPYISPKTGKSMTMHEYASGGRQQVREAKRRFANSRPNS